MRKTIVPREVGDHFGSGFTWLEFKWDGLYYRVDPVDGYKFVDNGWKFEVVLLPAHHMTPDIYFAGGYVVYATRVEE